MKDSGETATEWVFGLHAVQHLLSADADRVLEIALKAGRRDRRIRGLEQLARESGVRLISLPADAMDRLAGGGVHQGVVAKVRPAGAWGEARLFDWLENRDEAPFLLLVDGVQDPRNLGACLRTADGAGVQAVIAPRDRAAGLTATVRKVACGAAETVPFVQVTNLARTMRRLKEQGVWLVGAAADGRQRYDEADLGGALGVVVGGEERGLRRLTREHCDSLVALPMAGAAESLNVAVATGIFLYEAVRQRRQSG